MTGAALRTGYPAASFVRRLTAAGSDLGRQVERAVDEPLRRYLTGLVPDRAVRHNRHRHRFAETAARWLRGRRVEEPEAVADHLLAVPVIQQADHSNLLLDVETFLNNYLFHVACRETGQPIMVVSQCSTVSCLSRRIPVTGPVFLRTRGALYKAFPFSKRQYKDSSFCCLPGPLTMTLDTLEGTGPPAATDPFLARFVGRTWTDAAEAYRLCNEEIWDALPIDRTVRRVALDESVAAACAAEHLSDPSSPVHRIVFDPQVRETFLRTKRELIADPSNLAVNRAAPDFFWYRRGTRLDAVLLGRDAGRTVMVRETDGAPVPVPFEQEAIVTALRTGVLHCDRILAYLVRCLLPGIVAIGGTSQQDYVALYIRLMLETHRAAPFLDHDDVDTLQTPGLSRLGGMPLVAMSSPPAGVLTHLSPATDLAAFERAVLDEPLGRTIGTLSCASYFEKSLARWAGRKEPDA